MKRYNVGEDTNGNPWEEEHPEGEWVRAEEALEVEASRDKAMDEQHAKLVRVADEKRAALASLATANALLDEAKPLWQEWRDTDITADEDYWANFCNRAHRWHDRVIAHLAGQTAAPGKLETEMAKLGLHHVGESREDVKRRLYKVPGAVLQATGAWAEAMGLDVEKLEPGEPGK
jgi:hypothetical protein